ncbi:MAG: peptidylprolyl isomerase [Lachnospiraceae bacterium]
MEGMTAEELLEEVNAAIYTICVGGQSYKIGSRQLNRADLKTLYDIKNDLMAQVAGSTPGFLDDCFVAVFDRR